MKWIEHDDKIINLDRVNAIILSDYSVRFDFSDTHTEWFEFNTEKKAKMFYERLKDYLLPTGAKIEPDIS